MPPSEIRGIRQWLLNSPPGEWMVLRVRELLLGALRQGPVPKHVAFVMDGNRRYARERRMEAIEGHHLGFEALARILEVCYKSGVKVVTVYAFSTENFKRSKVEVNGLMEMAKVKLAQMSQHGELLQRYGAKIQVLGNMELVRPDIMEKVQKAVEMTKDNGDCTLNICFPYTSRHEMTMAIKDTVRDFSEPLRPSPKRPFSESRISRTIHSKALSAIVEVQQSGSSTPRTDSVVDGGEETDISMSGSASTADQAASSRTSASTSPTRSPPKEDKVLYPDPETITAETINAHTFTGDAPPLDLLIRTSGVRRLSDFMLWQCHQKTDIVFLDCLWPEFDLWQFLPVLVEWQWKQRHAEDLRSQGHHALKAS